MKETSMDIDAKTGEITDKVEEEEKSNVIPFGPVTSTKFGDGSGGSRPWLLDLPRGSTFLCTDNLDKDSFTCFCFHVIVTDTDYVVLLNNTNKDNIYTYVIPNIFSKRFALHKLVRRGSLPDEYFE